MKKVLIYLLPAIILTSCAQDQGDKSSHPTTTPGESIGEVYTLPEAPPEIYEAVDKNLQVYFGALNDQDFEKHIEMAYPGIFNSEDERELMIKTFSDWGEKGLKNYGHNVKLDHITPGVQLDTTMAYVAYFEGDFSVDFEDHYVGDPLAYKQQVAAAFNRIELEYDSVKTEYRGHGIQMVYAITSENYLDFRFISERFISSGRMGGIIDFDQLKVLKEYENEYNNK